VNRITIDPGPVLGELIPYGYLYLLVWIQSSPTSFCPLGAHSVKSSECADVNIWSGNEKERSLLERWERDRRDRREDGREDGRGVVTDSGPLALGRTSFVPLVKS
jgi:hypothetical protein